MALHGSRQKILSLFKQLHRTGQSVFGEDITAVAAAKLKINTEFKKHIEVQDPHKIEELVKVGEDAERALREMVIQAELNHEKGTFELKVTKDTYMNDNTMYDPNIQIPKRRRKRKTDCEEKPSS